jgi:nucleotide-binding universal stress UspA family protein
MFETIVVGHDGSTRADAAIELACALRDADRGRLILAAVVAGQDGRDAALARLERAAAGVPAGIGIETEVIEAHSPTAGLATLAGTRHADLLVLGLTHRDDLHRASGFTTSQHVLHAAPCTLAVAGARTAPPADGATVVVGYDGSVEANGALAAAYWLAAGRRGTVRLVRALSPMDSLTDDAAQSALDVAAARAPDGVATETRVLRGLPADRLLEEAADADLLVLGSRHYRMARRALEDSVSAAVLALSDLPVVVWTSPRPDPVVMPMWGAPEGATLDP